MGPVFGEPGRGLVHRGLFEMDEGGSVEEASLSLSEETPWRGPGVRELLHQGPCRMTRRPMGAVISLWEGPFAAGRNPE